MTPYMQIIIQFLYDAYSKKIMVTLLPPYLFHLLFVNIQLFANENMRDKQKELDDHSADVDEQQFNRIAGFSNAVVMICGIVNILNSFVFFMQTKSLGM